jgi:hypothetical protein
MWDADTAAHASSLSHLQPHLLPQQQQQQQQQQNYRAAGGEMFPDGNVPSRPEWAGLPLNLYPEGHPHGTNHHPVRSGGVAHNFYMSDFSFLRKGENHISVADHTTEAMLHRHDGISSNHLQVTLPVIV